MARARNLVLTLEGENPMELGYSRNVKASAISPAIVQACEAVSTKRLKRYVKAISSPRHIVRESASNLETSNWILNYFADFGLRSHFQGAARNIVGNSAVGNPKVIIGAHYDSVANCPGADDNASAVAAMLEATHVLTTLFPGIPLWAVAFNGEEEDLLGSKEFVKSLSPRIKSSLQEAHVLEMVGFTALTQKTPNGLPSIFPDTGDFIGILGNTGAANACTDILQSSATYLAEHYHACSLIVPPEAVIAAPVLGRSDHRSFWEGGIDAIMWTDTAEFRNPHYHQQSDTPETLDYEFLAYVVRLLVATIATRFA